MEKKQNFPSHAGLSGKALIASLFIISGILLFARNVGWITYDLFNVVVSWHSLLIILGIYTMTRRHYLSGATLTLIGVYFLIGGLSWLPENSQTIVWPVALIVAGILFFVKARRRERWMKSHMNGHYRDWARRGGGHMHMNMEDNEQQCESENGYLRSDNAFLYAMSFWTNYLKAPASGLHSEELSLTCATRILHREKPTSISTVPVVE